MTALTDLDGTLHKLTEQLFRPRGIMIASYGNCAADDAYNRTEAMEAWRAARESSAGHAFDVDAVCDAMHHMREYCTHSVPTKSIEAAVMRAKLTRAVAMAREDDDDSMPFYVSTGDFIAAAFLLSYSFRMRRSRVGAMMCMEMRL